MSIIDIGTNPLSPGIITNLAFPNTIAGPPINLAIKPDETLAIVANSLKVIDENGVLKQVPDNRQWVIDVATAPKLIDTVFIGESPLCPHLS